jgi:predicted nuclease with TOPRIM domain
MAIESENEVQSLNDKSDPTYDKLYDAIEYLYDEFKKLGSKYNTLKKNYTCLLVEKENLENKACIVSDKVNQLKSENKHLKEKVKKLTNTLSKFTQGSEIQKNYAFKSKVHV